MVDCWLCGKRIDFPFEKRIEVEFPHTRTGKIKMNLHGKCKANIEHYIEILKDSGMLFGKKMAFIDVNQSHDLEQTMNIAKKYAEMGHTVKIRLQDFHRDSEEHKALEWEVSVDYEYYLCKGCNHMKDETVHGVKIIEGQNYCNECASKKVIT